MTGAADRSVMRRRHLFTVCTYGERPFATYQCVVRLTGGRALTPEDDKAVKRRNSRFQKRDVLSHSGVLGRPLEPARLLKTNINVRLSITFCSKFSDAVGTSGAG